MQLAASVVMLFSVLVPAKMWFAPNQPIQVTVQSQRDASLVLVDFMGRVLDARGSADVTANQQLDVRQVFPQVNTPGTYVLFAVPRRQEAQAAKAEDAVMQPLEKTIEGFLGTPLVIEVRRDRRPHANPNDPMVIKIEPLRYAVMSTSQGQMTMAFYYDVAPHTVNHFLTLSEQGYYNGLIFHRIVPGFVVQGGDPLGTGMGGPGYHIIAEFSDRKHLPGVLSMARSGDPLEGQGLRPRPEFANSAGSQFFLMLEHRDHLDGRYSAFGKVMQGQDVVKALGAVPVADPQTGRPEEAPVIQNVEVRPVTAENNPYIQLWNELSAVEAAPAGAAPEQR
jgi:peptidyl-prolyl cis-trans isomerase B (cyclophilin B)